LSALNSILQLFYSQSYSCLQRVLLSYRHDISASHADVLVKAVMERCISENYVDKHISNLKVCKIC